MLSWLLGAVSTGHVSVGDGEKVVQFDTSKAHVNAAAWVGAISVVLNLMCVVIMTWVVIPSLERVVSQGEAAASRDAEQTHILTKLLDDNRQAYIKNSENISKAKATIEELGKLSKHAKDEEDRR